MRERAENERKFEIGVSRHAPKSAENNNQQSDISADEVDFEKAGEAIKIKAVELLNRLESAQPGTVMALEPSNIIRAKQTRDLLAGQLQEMLVERTDIELVSLGEDKEQAVLLLEQIKEQVSKKFIVADLRDSWLLGIREDQPFGVAAKKWDKKFNGDEDLRGAFWASHPQELSMLRQKLLAEGIQVPLEELKPSELLLTPEEAALRQIKWMQAMKRIGENYFPNRSLILEGISHHIISDFTSLALAGEDISLESVDRVLGGKFREPLARSSTTFFNDGSVKVESRGISKTYSADEFKNLIDKTRENSEARKTEWKEV